MSLRFVKESAPAHAQVLLIDLGTDRPEINEPIGLGVLTRALNDRFDGRVSVEQRIHPIHPLPTSDELRGVDILGLSTRIRSLRRLSLLVSRIRQLKPRHRPLLVLGDAIATYATAEVLELAPEALVVVGEGEDALVGIVDSWFRCDSDSALIKADLAESNVPNLAFMIRNDVVHTTRRRIDIPGRTSADRSLTLCVAERGGITRAESSRGCDYGKCSFCAAQHKYCGSAGRRPVPVDVVIEQLAELSDLGVRSPYFTDEDFIGDDPRHAMELASALATARQQGRVATDLTLYLDMRVDTILRPARCDKPSGLQVLRAMRQVGLREVFLGIESGAAGQVRRYRKAATASRNKAAVALVTSLGLTLDIGFIMFDPEMNLVELLDNLQFLREAGLWGHDSRLTKSLRVESNTPAAERYRHLGLVTGPLDLDLLEYPYRWLDARVEAVYHAFAQLESQRADEVYALQAKTRGEVASEGLRAELRERLGALRAAELKLLDRLVRSELSGDAPADPSSFLRCRDRLLRCG